MIRIYIDWLPELRTWYAEQTVPLICSKRLRLSAADPLTAAFSQRLSTLSEDAIRDILLFPPEELSQRYDWIREYIILCDAVALYPSFHEKHRGHAVSGARAEYIDQYWDCAFFREAFKDAHKAREMAVKSWRDLDAVIEKAEKRRELLDGVIAQKFDYSFLTDEIRGTLVEKMGIPVCPYCNRQYIQPVAIDGKKRYLGDLDHILPKSLYQLFSLSLWNLTPSCKACNQIFKRSRGARVLNPHERGFDEDCILVLEYHNVREIAGLEPPVRMRWEIQPSAGPGVRDQMENNLRIFRLNEIYDYHRRDIQRALRRRYLEESHGYRKSLNRVLSLPDDPSLWYGVSLEPSKFQEELLSKAIYDTVFHN